MVDGNPLSWYGCGQKEHIRGTRSLNIQYVLTNRNGQNQVESVHDNEKQEKEAEMESKDFYLSEGGEDEYTE